jgi:hypothetical protein
MAYLEAVSVHAFVRLERELRAHRAPASLIRDARRAAREERRHTKIMSALAGRRGVDPQMPTALKSANVRPLFDVVLENAVEGCVRETYGAVMGLIEAERATDASVRGAFRSVAADECRHAELAWAVHSWATSQLSKAQLEQIQRAMRAAITEIAATDKRTAELLFREVLARPAAIPVRQAPAAMSSLTAYRE